MAEVRITSYNVCYTKLLRTRPYQKLDDTEYFCSSPYLEFSDKDYSTINNNIGLYISGNRTVVKKLTLKLNINNKEQRAIAEETYIEICIDLLKRALPNHALDNAINKVKELKDISVNVTEHIRLSLEKNIWENNP